MEHQTPSVFPGNFRKRKQSVTVLWAFICLSSGRVAIPLAAVFTRPAKAPEAPARTMRLAERALRAWHLDLFTYVLSKVWFDLLFVYVLRLLPRPYCCPVGESPRQRLFFSLVLKQCSAAESTATPCRESASAAALLAAAAALLAALGLIDQGVQSLAMRNASAARLVQSVAGMFLGWALGHAYAHAISEGGGAVCGDGWTCSIFADLASAVLVTVSAAPLVAALLRLASCGGGADATAAEESSGERDGAGGVLRRCVCSCARLLAGGLSTMTMVAWALKSSIMETGQPLGALQALHESHADLCRADNESSAVCAAPQTAEALLRDASEYRLLLRRQIAPGGWRLPLTKRLLVLWAIALTFGAAAPPSRPAANAHSRMQHRPPPPGLSLLVVRLVRCRRSLEHGVEHARPARRTHAAAEPVDCQGAPALLLLVEAASGWATGCAWVDAVGALSHSFAALPSKGAWVILGDAGLTLLLHALAVGWLVAQRGRGEATEADEAEPEARSAAYNAPSRRVERWDFLTGAAAFCVGWGYIVCFRDCSFLLGLVFGHESEAWSRAGEVLFALALGTLLTVAALLLWLPARDSRSLAFAALEAVRLRPRRPAPSVAPRRRQPRVGGGGTPGPASGAGFSASAPEPLLRGHEKYYKQSNSDPVQCPSLGV
ncbi:hypothetical protein EMIHUDRAFT_194878 [Emiliania huxleyi CCMP1516]|uniref:Uncharacterized protein n=2 Tax=Emiliania huxleyi TaxID=2903 RepID=A0A0D3L2A6_EMIH1|nr:hypothetical protein EMIHUDRAFT_194878 [Emiliania huxleyi CCMP1516]EOD42141.1 hypothetical protein EMIHUDRAFT_194878 [Emiliania huxleyi CCMP1516]|eukprot:XP_005794570.1 hypothetical protein EMIHUDRAFT_194878 [Emiliania huxleyi CCMP1516]